MLVFIGGGNMASSLIGGLLAAGGSAAGIGVVEPDLGRAQALHTVHGVSLLEPGDARLNHAEALILAVKPQQLREAVAGLNPSPACTVISIAAGVRVDSLRAWLGVAPHLVRSMPNTPALYGRGITGLYAPPGTPDSARATAESILSAVGETCWLDDEGQLDAVTALSGSGPAYVFLLTEALAKAGVALGLEPELAAHLARSTLSGSAHMLEHSGLDPATLRTQVTSRRGTTEAALGVLEAGGLTSLFERALHAAAARSRELGDELARS